MFGALLNLALRNVLRNRRRSGLTLASVVIGVAALLFMQSLTKSLQADMANRAIGVFNSHLQIHSKDSKDPKIPEAAFPQSLELKGLLLQDTRVNAVSRRVIFTGLAASAANSLGAAVLGVDPEDEQKVSIITQYLREGRFLEKPGEIVLGAGVARNLDARLGEKVILMAQSREGALEGAALRVAGIYETGSYTWDASIIYTHIQNAQELLGWDQDVNAVAVKLKDSGNADTARKDLTAALEIEARGLKLLGWKDIGSEIVHFQKFQDAVLYLILIVVFAIVALGILNTMLMSLFERIREFGLMMALGAKRRHVAVLLLAESACLGATGLAWGAAWGLSIIGFFHFVGLPLPLGEALSYFLPFEKVLFLRFSWSSHLLAALCVVAVSAVAGILPAIRVSRLKAADALRHV